MRRALAAIAAAASALSPLGTLGCAEPARDGARPNLLLVTVDTLRADHLSSYGFPLETSPRIDAFAADAVVFERAIAGSSATVPSHASILASRYTRGHSVGYGNGESRLEDVETLAAVFREAGYATGAFVSNFLLQRRIGLDRGFDVYDDDLPSAELNQEKRRAMYREMQGLVRDDGGSVIPMYANYIDGVSTKVAHPEQMASNWELDGWKLLERWWFA